MGDYVDKNKFTPALGKWAKRRRSQMKAAERLGITDYRPFPMTDYIGDCILKICTNLRFKSCYINYPFADDMVSEAIEHCVRYAKNFDIEKSKYAFWYITTIAERTFHRRIAKEKKLHINHLLHVRQLFSEGDIRDALNADNPEDVKPYNGYIDQMLTTLDNMEIELPDSNTKKDKENKNIPIKNTSKETVDKKNNSLYNIMNGEEY